MNCTCVLKLATPIDAWDEALSAAHTAAWMPYEHGIGWEASAKAVDLLTNPYSQNALVVPPQD